ncbi:sugar phosphate isomerase/epimerase [Streptomyces sp. A1277]|uniref:sugar phosphate isomerase/epimerase family protein n=1 Tax=Streptomyces sp. A1277 TaxID=2563103 RepID=UPI0010A20705|nr:sugar phosphate isomerase/epimerase family protein [Streptomyces sp. A1277]THA28815.1 sugar phosphate isomerase/epimerase [Streptomyces sp. A1277]
MKLAFSTLGVPGLPMPEVVRLAAGHGYHGVELRAHPEEPVNLGTTASERAAVRAEFERRGVEVLAVAGYARVAAEGEDQPVLDELAALIELARDLGAPNVRVFPGGGDQAPEAADAIAARRLGAAAPYAADMGVRLLLETHDSHRAGADVARVAGTVGHKSIGALWDVMHTWLAGEEPVASHAVLAPHLGYVQVKDIVSADDTTPVGLGAGVLPLRACLDTLDADDWVCWEYEKRWYPQAAELPGLLGAGREHLLRLGAPKQ